MRKIINFIKNDIVLLVSFLLAVLSSFCVKPSKEYLSYIDFKTLTILLVLMLVISGLKASGYLDFLAYKLLLKSNSSISVYYLLVFLCFLSSMLITNDVALITFIPFTITILKMSNMLEKVSYIIIMETIAANLGSMITPIGNPQNLFLYNNFEISLKKFIFILFPYWVISIIILIISGFFIKKQSIVINDDKPNLLASKKDFTYLIVFALAVITVLNILNYKILLATALLIFLLYKRNLFRSVDYNLLLTFVFLFIFIGNISQIEEIYNFISNLINKNVFITAVASSQIISNVPAAILLSNFTNNYKDLLIGVNLGGLGTLIASMASLISYKILKKSNLKNKNYILYFTIINVILLVVFYLCHFALN